MVGLCLDCIDNVSNVEEDFDTLLLGMTNTFSLEVSDVSTSAEEEMI